MISRRKFLKYSLSCLATAVLPDIPTYSKSAVPNNIFPHAFSAKPIEFDAGYAPYIPFTITRTKIVAKNRRLKGTVSISLPEIFTVYDPSVIKLIEEEIKNKIEYKDVV